MHEEGLELKKIPPTYWHIHHSKQMHKSSLPYSRQAPIGRERERERNESELWRRLFVCHYETRLTVVYKLLYKGQGGHGAYL